ncbi:MAG TPA: hypothetical protein VFZ25_14195, partial [Chloroflexota bacterium]|nr:hypothetical protein [Chloroflexota bacterium]
YWDLPDHQGSSFSGDHYIVALGTDGANTIVYNDPASNAGAYVRITTDKLQHAWRDPASGIATTAMSVYR